MILRPKNVIRIVLLACIRILIRMYVYIVNHLVLIVKTMQINVQLVMQIAIYQLCIKKIVLRSALMVQQVLEEYVVIVNRLVSLASILSTLV